MLGAIFGDILGSTSEEIPRHPMRKEMTPTDDSFLTCACKDWIENLTSKEISEFLINNKHADMFDTYAVKTLQKWWNYFPEQGFSRGFNTWAKMEHPPRGTRGTNGCLMRNSPIVPAMLKNSFYLRDDSVAMSKVFAAITHNDERALKSVELHTEMIFLGLVGELNKDKLEEIISSTKMPEFELKGVEYWKEKEEFVWDAQRSLSIAVSAILEANSYKEAMDKCCYIGKDADTYAAIAGPIAETLWGIDDSTRDLCVSKLEKFQRIKTLYSLK